MTNATESKTFVLEGYNAIISLTVHQLPTLYTKDLLYFRTFKKINTIKNQNKRKLNVHRQ